MSNRSPAGPALPPGAAVTSLRPTARDPTKVSITVNRKHIATIDQRQVDRLGLAVGVPWTESLARQVEQACLADRLRAYAVRTLARRPLSRAELVRRLTARSLEPAGAAALADELARVGLVDDRAVAESLVRGQLARKPAGRALLLAKLAQKRVDRAAARAAVDEALAGVDQGRQAADLARQRLRTMPASLDPQAVRRRLYGYLARRGFDPDACMTAVRAAMSATTDEA
jgi:regulatory protein